MKKISTEDIIKVNLLKDLREEILTEYRERYGHDIHNPMKGLLRASGIVDEHIEEIEKKYKKEHFYFGKKLKIN